MMYVQMEHRTAWQRSSSDQCLRLSLAGRACFEQLHISDGQQSRAGEGQRSSLFGEERLLWLTYLLPLLQVHLLELAFDPLPAKDQYLTAEQRTSLITSSTLGSTV
eukprot:104521-Hanusia_phi.AAC.2